MPSGLDAAETRRYAFGAIERTARGEDTMAAKKSKNLKAKLPSRHVSVGPASAPHRAFYYAMGMTDQEIG